MRKSLAYAMLPVALLMGTALAPAQGVAPGNEDPNNWPQYHRTSNGWRYSPLDQVNKDNVARLHVAWINQAGDITGGLQETPLVVDGVVYSISAGNRVSAIDGKTGKEVWRHDTKLDPLTAQKPFPHSAVGSLLASARSSMEASTDAPSL
jgi:alcohol dehydrogenase (cytochrome c)